MNGTEFDRSLKALAAKIARRRALGGSIGGVLAVVAAPLRRDATAKKKRCRKLNQGCASTEACCCNSLGVLGCREHVKPQCVSKFPGDRCCGLEGVRCGDICDCCDDLVCDLAADDELRCLPSEP
jgi:hypothetical protein